LAPLFSSSITQRDDERKFFTARVRLARAICAFLTRRSFKGAGRLRTWVSRILVPPPVGPVVVPTVLGFSVYAEPRVGKGVEQALYYEGIYEAGTLHVLQHLLRPGNTFVDVGANIGLMSLASARAVGPTGHVYAFEPVPSTFELLQRNIALNRSTNIHAYEVALGAAPEERPMYERPAVNRGAATLVPCETPSVAAVVTVESLDRFLKRARVQHVHVIKIDVEGWELPVLVGSQELLRSEAAPALVVEYSTAVRVPSGSRRDLYELLASVNDYRLFKLSRGKDSISKLQPIRGQRDLPSEDNLFCFRPAHLEGPVGALVARE